MTLNYSTTLTLNGTNQRVYAGDTISHQLNTRVTNNFTDGNGSGQANGYFKDNNRQLVATSEDLDLSGVLLDGFGNVLTPTSIKTLIIANLNTGAGENLIIGGAAANAFLLFDDPTDQYTIGPGGVFFINDPDQGRPVTPSTGDLLKLDAGANTINFWIEICGAA